MTHHLTPYHSHNPAAAPTGPKSVFNHFIDLAPFQQVVEGLAQLIRLYMRGFDMDKLEQLCRRKTTADKRLEKAKLHNFKVGLKWNMLRQKAWREKVLADLGGEAALKKWDKRVDAAYLRERQTAKPLPYKRPDLEALRAGDYTPPKPRSGPKTDSTGVFRLAPIPGRKRTDAEGFSLYDWEREEQAEARRLRAGLRETADVGTGAVIDRAAIKGLWVEDEINNIITVMRPIPLLADELRGIGIDEIADEPDDTNNIVIPEKTHSVAHPGSRPDRSEVPHHALGTKIIPKNPHHASTGSRRAAWRLCALLGRDDNDTDNPKPPP